MTAPALHQVLQETQDWPADHVAAAVLTGGREHAVGDMHRSFPLASVTKLLSAYAALLAVEEGAVGLDDPMGPPGSTVRHLLAHASGVAFDSREQVKPVGQRRIYSSAGYELLADALTDLTEIPFPEYLREGVCAPLGMESTFLEGSAGHGGVSTAADLLLFARELLSPTLLHPQTVREAFSPQFPELRGIVPGYGMHKPCSWGLGFEIHGEKRPHWVGESMPGDVVGHFGMTGTYLWVAPEHNCAMVALTDRDFGPWAAERWAETNDRVWAAVTG
ncbi:MULTISPECIES: serine hydrolase domain-containing protein [unclassified Corynebacterium]|uniref:serine hydrolase domain-containing protein n=1 Tax=unclassified Corynebacterium TaxID=2624378 RepID=UPI0029CA38C5|nr:MULTISPECIES: serine hydrolase domain-containing protein [unclassified Corynebacterium]WPF65525.1 serine hydrolase domain-containing protein [Corynebacterium sp. 22KM0430]WPF68020.1 serine hydrolase domain-containing protein [Corynebacterium sp. 21KM1197]